MKSYYRHTFVVIVWLLLAQDGQTAGITAIGPSVEPSYDSKCREENTVDSEICAKFSVGDENQGFIYSPNYPNIYPNSTECARCIEAPHGRFIKLEFRDHFNMEESASCEYDKLEIRNGKFGYSDLLATLCGHDFPNEIASSDRFLWLRFKSDESIEYSGFKIYYQFVPLASPKPMPPKDCSEDIVGRSSGVISHEHISRENLRYSEMNQAPLECVWSIEVEPKNKMYVNFLVYKLEKPNDCEMNYIDIYEENFNEEKRKQRFCGTSTEPFKSDSNKVRIRFHAKPGALNAKFSLLYTSFREVRNKEKCDAHSEFDCNDGTCIDMRLKCNQEDNCKYRYDEDKSLCMPAGSGLSTLMDNHMIIILVVFFALVIGMCASIIVSCWGKIQERRQREIDYKMRVSSHPSLDAIDRMNLVIGSTAGKPLSTQQAQQQQLLMRSALGASGVAGAVGAKALSAQQQQQLLLLSSRNNSEEQEETMEEDDEPEEEELMEDDEEPDEEGDEMEMLDDEEQGEEDEDDDETLGACYLPSGRTGSSAMLLLDDSYASRLPQQHSIESNQSADLISPSDSCPLFYHHHRHAAQRPGGTCNPLHVYTQHHLPAHHSVVGGVNTSTAMQLHPFSGGQTDSSLNSNASNCSESPIPPPPPPPAISHLRNAAVRAGTPLSAGSSSCTLLPTQPCSSAAAAAAAAALSLDVSKLPPMLNSGALHGASSHPHLHHASSHQQLLSHSSATPPAPPPPGMAGTLTRHLSQRQLQIQHASHCAAHGISLGSMQSTSLDSEQASSEPLTKRQSSLNCAPDVLLLR